MNRLTLVGRQVMQVSLPASLSVRGFARFPDRKVSDAEKSDAIRKRLKDKTGLHTTSSSLHMTGVDATKHSHSDIWGLAREHEKTSRNKANQTNQTSKTSSKTGASQTGYQGRTEKNQTANTASTASSAGSKPHSFVRVSSSQINIGSDGKGSFKRYHGESTDDAPIDYVFEEGVVEEGKLKVVSSKRGDQSILFNQEMPSAISNKSSNKSGTSAASSNKLSSKKK